MQDLLSIGEAFAELDLAVRQLDDGSLTLAVDDGLQDTERVRVVGREDGFEGSLRVAKAPALTCELAKAMDRLNGDSGPVRFVWRDGEVRASAHLPWGDRSYAENQLRVFYGALAEAEARYGNAFRAAIGGQGSWGSLYDSAEMLPPSYLAGAGQASSDDSLAQRHDLPGRSDSGRTERQQPASSGSAGRGLVLLMPVVVAAGVAGWFVTRAPDAVATGPSVEPSTPAVSPAGTRSDAEPPIGDEDEAPEDSEASADSEGREVAEDPDETEGPAGVAEPEGDSTGSDPPPPPTPSPQAHDEEGILAAVRASPDQRAELVGRWVERGLDRAEGARRRMLEALGGDGDFDPDVGRTLLQSFREHPVDAYEAMDCFALTQGGLRRELLAVLGQARGEAAEDVITFLEARRSEGSQIDETLLALGAGGAEAYLTVAEARGMDWVTIGRGNELLRGLAERDLLGLRPLLAARDDALRAHVLTVLRGVEGQDADALRLFAACLEDRAPAVRQQAVHGIVDLGDPKAAWALARALVRETDDQTVDALRGAFLRLPSDATVDMLSRLYRKRDPQDRLAAIRGLEATQTAGGVAALLGALGDEALQVRRAALEGLETLHKRSPDLRPAVAEGLGAIRELALSGDDAELTRLAKNLHYRIAGSMPR